MIAGFIADKLGHRKGLVLAGYTLTPVGQMLITLAVRPFGIGDFSHAPLVLAATPLLTPTFGVV